VFEDPSDYTPILDEDIAASTYCEPAREYLRSRGVTVQIQREAMIGISLRGRDANRIIVPCLDASGAWWGWVGRSWAPGRQRRYQTAPKMRRDQLYNAVALERITDDPVIVVEGVFDALPFWPDACACLGKPGDAQRRSLLETTRPIVVCLDGDAWEEGEQLANWLRFNDARAIAIRLPPAEDPGSMGQAWVRDAVSAALGGRTK
jgi:DNA primase